MNGWVGSKGEGSLARSWGETSQADDDDDGKWKSQGKRTGQGKDRDQRGSEVTERIDDDETHATRVVARFGKTSSSVG